MQNKLLLTDPHSALGQALGYELERETFTLLSPSEHEVNWLDRESVRGYFKLNLPHMVVNSFGWAPQLDPHQQSQMVQVVTHLAEACAELNIPILHFSSYAVFGEDNKGSHAEKDEPNPISNTGKAYLQAEQILNDHLDRFIVLRLSWVIGSYGDNHLTRLLDNFLSGEAIKPVHNRLKGAPTTLMDIARVAIAVVKQTLCGAENWGVMHYCSADPCTEAELARHVIQALEQLQLVDQLVLPIEDNLSSTEPVSAILSCRVIRDNFGVQPRVWKTGLVPMIKLWVALKEEAAK